MALGYSQRCVTVARKLENTGIPPLTSLYIKVASGAPTNVIAGFTSTQSPWYCGQYLGISDSFSLVPGFNSSVVHVYNLSF